MPRSTQKNQGYNVIDNVTVLRNGDQDMCVSDKEPQKAKSIINKVNTDRRIKDLQNQLWVGKFVTQHWSDSQISNNSYDILKQWKNILDTIMSINTSIRQQLLNTKTYRSQKVYEQVEDLFCLLWFEKQETVSHVLCGCSRIAQSLYKTQYDKIRCPVYHALREKYGFDESDYSSPWFMQSHTLPSQENNKVKIFWDIPWQLEKCPKDSANNTNKPDVSILDKKYKEWSLMEGTISTPGTIAEIIKYKQNKYVDLKLGIKNLYLGYKVKLITIVFEYLGAYDKDLDKELNILFGLKVARQTIECSQIWVISHNCEILKRFWYVQLCKCMNIIVERTDFSIIYCAP